MRTLITILTIFLLAMKGFAQQKDSAKQCVPERVYFCNDQVKEEEIKGLIIPSFPGGQDSLTAYFRRVLPDSVEDYCDSLEVRLAVDTLGHVVVEGIFPPPDHPHREVILAAIQEMPLWNPSLYVNSAGVSRKQRWTVYVHVVF